MLDNEPTGAERPGAQPAGETAAPVRRTRARKTTAAAAGGEAAGTAAPTRRRRAKAATPDISDVGGVSGQTASEGTDAAPSSEGAAAPAKATRSRRRKAAEPAARAADADSGPAAQAVGGVPPTLSTGSAARAEAAPASGGAPGGSAAHRGSAASDGAPRGSRSTAGRGGDVSPGAAPIVGGTAVDGELDEDEAEDASTAAVAAGTPTGAAAQASGAASGAAVGAAGSAAGSAAGRSRADATAAGGNADSELTSGTAARGSTASGATGSTAGSDPTEGGFTDDLAAGPPTASRPRSRRGRTARDAADTDVNTDALDGESAGEGGRRAPTPPPVLFMAPQPDEAAAAATTRHSRRGAKAAPPAEAGPTADEPQAATPTSRRSRRGAKAAPPAEAGPTADEPQPTAAALDEAEPAETGRRRRRARRTAEPVDTEAEGEADSTETDAAEDEDESDDSAAGRHRRRGRRGRGRGKGPLDEGDDTEGPAAVEAPAEEDDEGDGLTRRRRRRRRKGDADSPADDGVHTVVRIRERRSSADEVQGVSGSTRLEAKRQRRRDGREQRRTRPPILSESEFLARREAVDRQMVVRQRGERTQIAVLEDGILVEHYVARALSGTMAGSVYLGKVQNVLPSMEAAFVDVGRGRNAVLYAGEVNWDATGLEGRARSIEQALRSGDAVLVQVTKDPIGHKGARLTSHIALSGRHLVYVPGGNASGISRKLPDNERKRLRDVLKKLLPDGAGVIVRTAAEGASEDELARDVKRLQAQWEDIQRKAAEGGAPVQLYEEPDLVIRVVRDLFNEDFRELVIQGDEAFETVESYLTHVSPDLVPRLHRHTGSVDVFAEKRIDEQILKGLDRKVFLPSGGHLVIDRTEAMTVVDVNTGKYTGQGGNLEETVTRNNLEAAEEIVRQLRLRDLGGIVVIDFIDMVLESNRELVLRRLTECLGRDRTKHQVTEITSLGLVQMTRKRIGAGLLEAFSEVCEHCKGRGVIIHTEPVQARASAGDRVKAVASAPAATGSRRRGRKAAEPAAVQIPAAVVTDADDTMGYDLSRYEDVSIDPVDESDVAAVVDVDVTEEPEEPDGRLAGADDPDAADADDEPTTGRRRGRRGGARRRTRP
jgi:ribonuclease E